MALTLSISPHRRPLLEESREDRDGVLSVSATERIRQAFAVDDASGLLHLATAELATPLPPPLAFAQDVARRYLTRLCHTPGLEAGADVEPIPPPQADELAAMALAAPPMKGLEYLSAQALADWWERVDHHVRERIRSYPGGATAFLHDKNPLWRLVGKVTFHLAENKRDEAHPFAFLATYASRLSSQGRVQHLPLSRALHEYAGAGNRTGLVWLLTPIQQASDRCPWVKELVESSGVYQAIAWTARQAHRFLQDIPLLEECGIIVHVPDWWKSKSPPRPQVSVKIGQRACGRLGLDAMLDFSVDLTLDGESLGEAELRELLGSSGGLVRLRGRWVEVDREKLAAALEHWKRVEREARDGGISFFEGMRLLAGANLDLGSVAPTAEPLRQWTGIAAGDWLSKALAELHDPQSIADATPPELRAELRPYQKAGVHWLRLTTRLGLGACLADDMGLGKTIQVLALLLHERRDPSPRRPSLLVVPASLIANWKAEITRFAPCLSVFIAHPSETEIDLQDENALSAVLAGCDLAITTYAMLSRLESLRRRTWRLVILDEAQAIKNAGTRQARAAKEAAAASRIALTGTPVENRLSDLWSLFDFLNPGLLGDAKSFARFSKQLAERHDHGYGPLRALVRPYILRRLKTDKQVIADLPEKTEVKAFCPLSKQQAALYEQSVRELAQTIRTVDGIQRRGVVLAYLTRFKQICNHPAQWRGDGDFDPQLSGKFQRLAELCQELAERQEKVLVFTQFREIADPLAEHLRGVFGRGGLVLHGGTALGKRRKMVESFQRDDGPPFFVLSLKAGGTGLNLTAACHVIHFDRWWNPAVENQATDRAFRIGQKRNVVVHKFICRGTVEEKIDALIADKVALSRELLDEGGAKLLTEMTNDELLRFVALDINKAVEN